MINYLFSDPLIFIVYLISLLIAITIHEFSHAYVADYLGDPTPRLQGRLKLDPRVHIDSIGMIMLLLIGFGWGKPVEFDPYNLKNPRRDAGLISIAGPLSNFLLAIILSIVLRLLNLFEQNIISTIGLFLVPVIRMNLILGIFNLIPIHPLDGFKVVGGILPREKAQEWYSLQRFGWIFLILLIIPFFGGRSLLDGVLQPVINFFTNLLISLPNTGIM